MISLPVYSYAIRLILPSVSTLISSAKYNVCVILSPTMNDIGILVSSPIVFSSVTRTLYGGMPSGKTFTVYGSVTLLLSSPSPSISTKPTSSTWSSTSGT